METDRNPQARQKIQATSKLIKRLKLSSSIFAIIGGVLLALNIKISGYGFIFLAMSSGQMLVASILMRDKMMIFYSGSLFIFVDCFGIYRWLLA